MADHEELLDDLIYFARAGELGDLKETKVSSPEFYVEKDESGKTALHMAAANNHLGKLSICQVSVSKLN
jgi:ankyrin repeat protein